MAAFWGAPYLEHEAHLANLLYNEMAPLAAHEDVDRAQSPQRPSSQGSGRSGSAGKERCGERFSSRGLAFMGSAGSGHQVFVASYPAALRTARSIFEHMQARHVRLHTVTHGHIHDRPLHFRAHAGASRAVTIQPCCHVPPEHTWLLRVPSPPPSSAYRSPLISHIAEE